MSQNNFDELIAAAAEEIAFVESRSIEILAEIGRKAFPEICDKPDFAELIAKLGEIEKQTGEIQKRIENLREEKERYELEEKKRLEKCTCYYCKKVNEENAMFCEECGARLGEPPREYCKSCGTMNQPNMKFCGECGTKLSDIIA